MEKLRYTSLKKGDILLIKLAGSLDLNTASKLSDKLGDEIKKGARKIVLNLAGVDYMASAGLGTIISAENMLTKNGGELRLSSLSEKITKIFELIGFSHVFKTFDSDDEAVNSF